MKKRLLLSLLAVCTAVAGFALEVNEYVYTPQGRFKITESPVKTSNFDADLTGWTGVSATEGKAAKDIFVWNEDGCASGIHSVKSTDATIGEGMYFKFEPNGQTCVVSFKMKGATATSIRKNLTATTGDGKNNVVNLANVVRVQGNSANVFGDATDEYIANTGEELSEEWKTFNYAITGDKTSLYYFISFTGMATTIEIADLQIAPAVQVADLRQRDAMIEKMEAYKNVYAWDEGALEDLEVLGALKEIGDESQQNELDEILVDCQDALSIFLKTNMDDYLADNAKNYLGNDLGKISNGSYGSWTNYGRAYCTSGDYPDLGHYQASNTWNNGSPDSPMGVSRQFDLLTGSYVFSIESRAAVREPGCKQTWNLDEGMEPAYGIIYISKIVDGADPEIIASVQKDLKPMDYTPFVLPVKIESDGKYEIGYKAYCKDTHKTLKVGSVTYVKDARFYGKNGSKYNQAELSYEADVREQITTGRAQLTKAAEYLADANKFWGKPELQSSMEVVEPKIAAYEQYDQNAIIATFDAEAYNKANSTKNAEEGLLVFEVYDTAVKDILAANRRFEALNDTLESLQVAIDAAEAVLAERIYGAATGKADLQDEIESAKGLLVSMKKLEYSEENASFIEAEKLVLSEAVEEFKASIPASAITEIVNLDFENGAKQNEETQLYEVAGSNTVMSFSYFSTETPATASDLPFELGFDSNGAKVLPGVLRVGNGSGTATVPVQEYGSNILKVSMDWWFGRLTGRYTGFDLLDAENTRVAGLYFSPYDGTFGSGYDDFNLDACDTDGANNSIKGFFIASTAGDDGFVVDDNKTHMEIIIDFGEKSMYLVSTTSSGMLTSNKVAFNGLVPTQFVVKSNYANYNGRRSWFDNLKMEVITADPTEPFVPSGIEEIANPETEVKAPVKYFKNGRIVINGKYGINGVLIK